LIARDARLVTDRLNPAEDLRPAFDTIDRNSINIIVPVHKSVQLTTRCLNSLAEHIQEIAPKNRLALGSTSFNQQDMGLKP
jgi:hypothetical protein